MTDQMASVAPPDRISPLTRAQQIVFSSPLVMIASLVLAIVVLSAIFAPWVVPHDPVRLTPSVRLKPPSDTYWLGTDAFGR